MRLCRSRRDAEAFADFVVRAAGGYELHDLTLTRRDGRERAGEHRVDIQQ